MNSALLASLVATALLASPPVTARDEPVIMLDHRHFAATGEAPPSTDSWKRWADDFSTELRSSMGTLFGARLDSGKVVKGAPYSAEVLTEANQALADGNVISRKTRGAVYRDSEGRTRQEMPGDGKEPTIFINDPVEGKHLILTPGAKRAIVTGNLAPKAPGTHQHTEKQVIRLGGKEVRVEDGKVYVDGKEATAGRVDVVSGGKAIRVENGKVTIDGKPVGEGYGSGTKVTIGAHESGDGTRREEVRVQVLRSGDDRLIPVPPIPPMPPGALHAPLAPLPPMPGVHTFRFESTGKLGKGVTTNLGMKDFDGVKAEGKSTVWTIAAGEIGNRNPINVSSESWYSPDLQLAVYSRYNDPRTGETIYRLAGIRRAEPAADLFRVPADYELKRRGSNGNRR